MFKGLNEKVSAILLGASVLGFITSTPALADPPQGRGWDRDRHHERDWRDDHRDRARGRGPVYHYDFNRPDPRYRGYYANRYYRPANRYGYQPIRVTRQTRIYRGDDNRYYCRRSDGTTGLIVGAVLGGVIGNQLDRGRSSPLGVLLGAGAGAALGSSIDRGNVTCR